MGEQFLLSIDQGTTSSRVLLVDGAGTPVFARSEALQQYFPEPGSVEHDAMEIWACVRGLVGLAVEHAGGADRIAAIGITNQRETTVVWDRKTGQPIHRALVWQDRRTAARCENMHRDGAETMVQAATGLVLDPYFSATKIAWILDNCDGARSRAENGELCFGTIDSWLVWQLTGGRCHVTDTSNASRTLLFDLSGGDWSPALLDLFTVPAAMLPRVLPSQGSFGETSPNLYGKAIPILGVAGDQQAATFGQACFDPGMVKATFGTGCFVLANVGPSRAVSYNRLLGTVAWAREDKTHYALEGSIFMAGATMQWLRDGLGLFVDAGETEAIASSIDDTAGVYMVPAFAGLGAPYWDAGARGAIVGLTRGSGRAEIIRAGLEAVAFQTRDLIGALAGDMADAGLAPPTCLRVDGGMTTNRWFMQFLADQLNVTVERATCAEATALGAAHLAGLEVGMFASTAALSDLWQCDATFEPCEERHVADELYVGWCDAVDRVRVSKDADARL
jgi:glycerol kinase